jgi:hypothetical protein
MAKKAKAKKAVKKSKTMARAAAVKAKGARKGSRRSG